MKFYTNVQLIGNKFLVRGYDNGEHVQYRDDYNPTLFVPSKKESKYRTLEGERVEPIQPGFVRDCREFYKKYQDCLLYTSPSPRDRQKSRMPSSA